jgi:hypothetical protein
MSLMAVITDGLDDLDENDVHMMYSTNVIFVNNDDVNVMHSTNAKSVVSNDGLNDCNIND